MGLIKEVLLLPAAPLAHPWALLSLVGPMAMYDFVPNE